MSMFRVILENELDRRGMSIREAAKEIGISHTTLIAAKDGTRSMDVSTALAIAKWVGVPLSTLVEEANPEESGKSGLLYAVAMVLEAAPELEKTFRAAAEELAAGTLSLNDFKDLAEYAAYKIRIRREQAQAKDQGKTLKEN
jgi:transcriptional regulator with XRE-family HTH domain